MYMQSRSRMKRKVRNDDDYGATTTTATTTTTTRGRKGLLEIIEVPVRKVSGQLQERRIGGREFQILGRCDREATSALLCVRKQIGIGRPCVGNEQECDCKYAGCE